MAGDDPILAGPPSSVSGFIPFHNDTGSAIALEQIEIKDDAGTEETFDIEPVTVDPDDTARIAVTLTLEPQTEPKEYDLWATIDKATIAVKACVAETRVVGISPEALVVDNIPEAVVDKYLVVANEGNVPVYVADFGDVPLYREDGALATLLALARPAPDLVQQPVDPLRQPAATMAVATAGGRVEVPPGESRTVALTFTVPADLPQTARYVAALPVAVRTVLVAVVPAGPEPN